MKIKKLININEEQKQSFEEIREEIKDNGALVSTNQLVRDAIQILLNYHKNEIIEKYSPFYRKLRVQEYVIIVELI